MSQHRTCSHPCTFLLPDLISLLLLRTFSLVSFFLSVMGDRADQGWDVSLTVDVVSVSISLVTYSCLTMSESMWLPPAVSLDVLRDLMFISG